MFEISPMLSALINISIDVNAFSPSKVRLYHNAVSDMQTNSSVELESTVIGMSESATPMSITTVQLDDVDWPSSIFLLKIFFDDGELDALRSAQRLFEQKRIQHLLLYMNTVLNDQRVKQDILEHVQKGLRPKYMYAFHPSENILFGPLNNYNVRALVAQQYTEEPVIGILAIFDREIRRSSIKAERFDTNIFFS